MKINRITISNISSYAGEVTFDFMVTEQKNVILIGGQNGTGKTSLFTALKLALYGHLCFNYQSANGPYMSKVKELINHDAYASENVSAFVEVDIEIPSEREVVSYTIRREWEFFSQKLSEVLTVSTNNNVLPENEVLFFQNYLFTILPPNLFDFFFFDGELVADFFSTSNYNSFIKNALLTLCSFDTFEIIRKFCDNYVSTNENSDELNSITSKYEAITNEIDVMENKIETQVEYIEKLESELSKILIKKDELELNFKNSGGLKEAEKEELLRKSRELEKIKSENNLRIKSFVEGMMPFIIAKDVASTVNEQLAKEDTVQKFSALKDKLESKEITNSVVNTINDFKIKTDSNAFSIELIKAIVFAVSPDIDIDNFTFHHDLSKEQQNKVLAILSYVDTFTNKAIIKMIKEKDRATKKTIEINKRLREAMSDIDTESYFVKINELTKCEYENQNNLHHAIAEQECDKNELERLKLERDGVRNQLVLNAKNRNIYGLCDKISVVLENMITELTKSKFHQVASITLNTLKKIMRKDNFIDLVELDENFMIYLYKEQMYEYIEIENLVRNVGVDELENRIGAVGVNRLLNVLNIDSLSSLKASINKNVNQMSLYNGNEICLYKKIELNQLSKGEKQVFILALYYAIIKVSGKDIPFIIDTPYARIDTEHREQISKEFFPNISGQVIILSTDEEITVPYYAALKPFIAKEYLLNYNENESKTTINSGYFYKEGEG